MSASAAPARCLVRSPMVAAPMSWGGSSAQLNRELRLEKCVDVVGEQLRVLVQESVAGVWIDPQLGVREVFSEQVAVLRVHHRVVVAVGDKRRLGYAGETVEL